MKQIGILGGTFNPIHNGHLILAQSALEQFELDQVLFIPSGCSYMKKHVLDAGLRFEMTKLAIESNPLFQISGIEVDRPGNSYTCDTLTRLKEIYPECKFHYIIGADTLFSIETWHKPELIFENCSIICSKREGFGTEEMQQKKDELTEKYHADIRFLEERAFDISSSEIRERLKNHLNTSYFLPEKVLIYIKEHHLYQFRETRR